MTIIELNIAGLQLTRCTPDNEDRKRSWRRAWWRTPNRVRPVSDQAA
jgi:hypothetical protein